MIHGDADVLEKQICTSPVHIQALYVDEPDVLGA